MTKITLYAMVFVISLSIGICSTAGAQQKLLREISIELNHKEGSSLVKVIKEIEKSSEFLFLYSPKELKDVNVDLSSGIWNMNDLLHEISNQAKLSIKRVNETISVTAVEANSQVVEMITTQQQVTGTVTDQEGEVLPGASVVVSGTTMGTITDIDGNYSLNVPSDAETLDISFVGMTTQTIAINGRSVINVTLESDVGQLQEVIVVGMGQNKLRKDLTGSIATVDSKTIEKTSFLSPQFALQGNAPGVRVLNTSGDPNAQPQVQVRGIGTWNGRSQPLYVIDGQIINDPSDFGNQDVIAGSGRQTPLNLWNLINPQDIESISVLKDASAAAVYGSRAANGVVLITTRKGRAGAPTVEFSTRYGWSTVPKEERMLNAKQWVDLNREAHNNSNDPTREIGLALYGEGQPLSVQLANYTPQMNPAHPWYINENTTENYNWQDELLRTALDQSYDVKVSGGSEKMNYYVSLGMKDQEHPHVGNEARRYTGAVNINADFTKWLRGGINYKYANSENRVQEQTMSAIVNHAPWQPIFSNDPNRSTDGFAHVIAPPDSSWQPLRIYGQGGSSNYLADQFYDISRFEFQRNIVQGYLEIEPLEGLRLRGSLNLDQTEQNRFTLSDYATEIFSEAGRDPATISNNAPNSVGSINDRTNWFFNYQADLTLTYDKSFGKHTASILLAAQDTYRKQHYRNSSGSNITRFNPLHKDRTGYGNDIENNSSIKGYNDAFWFGYVARGGYNYDSKYYIDLSFRRDASSGFAEEYRWGNFYSVAGAWRISSETFLDGLTFINDLKLRGGYGEAGNDEAAVGNFAFLSTVGSSGSYRFGSGNGNTLGNYSQVSVVNDFPNFSLSWETGQTIYAGFDATLFNNKMSLTTEVYRRTTKGILQRVNLAPSVGTGNPLFNLGELQNDGIDIDLGWNDKIGEFEFGINGNISFLRNQITKLFQDQPFYVEDPFGGPTRRIEVGRSIGHIWGYVVEGIYQSQQEIDDRNAVLNDQTINLAFVQPGDMYFKNVGGNPDSVNLFYSPVPDTLLNTFDQTEIGNTLPSFIYGLNLTAGWKGIDVQLSFYGEGGAEKINNYRRNLESLGGGGGQNMINTTLNRWTPENPSTTMPRAVSGDPAGNHRQQSTRWVESTDYFRLNNWQVGYTLPTSLLSSMNNVVSNARIFVGGQNNFLLTRWSGLDPVNDDRPLPRTFLLGLNVKF